MNNITEETTLKMLFGEIEYPFEFFVESNLAWDTRAFLLPDFSKGGNKNELLFNSAIHYLKNNNRLYYHVTKDFDYRYDYHLEFDDFVDSIPTKEIGVYAVDSLYL